MNLQKLIGIIPENVISELSSRTDLNDLQIAHFLAQCGHESGGFKVVYENLNYSADGLRKVFPKYFPTIEKANEYARQPQKIGALVYANRMGNGSELSNDGYTYRGRGYIQLTGKDNYKAFSEYINYDCVKEPAIVGTKYPLSSALFYFDKNKLFDLCTDSSIDTITKITKRVNGGTNGLEDRIEWFNKIYLALK